METETNSQTQNSKNNSNNYQKTVILQGIGAFSIALVIAAAIIGSSIKKLRTERTVSVKGYAEMDIVSDFATWGANITVTSSTMQEGYDKLKEQIDKVMQYLEKNGIKNEDIELRNLYSEDIIEYFAGGGSKHNGYRLNQSFSLSSKDLLKVKNLSIEITELIREGIAITSFAPQYSYTKLNDLKVKMLGEATKDARLRAEQIAKSGGNEIGGIISASQGVFQITVPNSNEVNDYGISDMSSINKTIKSVVTAEFSIE